MVHPDDRDRLREAFDALVDDAGDEGEDEQRAATSTVSATPTAPAGRSTSARRASSTTRSFRAWS
jgi:hypothetical protein